MARSPKKQTTEVAKDPDWPACQIMLVLEPGPGARERLQAALSAATIAAVVIKPKAGDKLGAGEVKPLVALAQDQGAAAILCDDVELVKTLHADGVHFQAVPSLALMPGGDIRARVTQARAALGDEISIGVDAGTSRHNAMEAGEAGAEYVAFGVGDGSAEARAGRDALVAWWAGIFEVPCVALDIETLAEVIQADTDGSDFVALSAPLSRATSEIAELAGATDAHLSQATETGE